MTGSHEWEYIAGGKTHTCVGNLVYQNTVVGNQGVGLVFITQAPGNPEVMVQGNVVENTLFWGNNGTGADVGQSANCQVLLVLGGGTVDEWQRWYNNGAWSCNGNVVAHNRFGRGTADPQFGVIAPYGGYGEFTNPYGLAAFAAKLPALMGTTNVAATADPLFTAPSATPLAGDYTLQAASPARNAGAVLAGYAYDGAAPDLGAFERVRA